jgi:putative glutamine amidotransferase
MADATVIGVTGAATRLPWAWWATRWSLRRLGVDARRLTPASDHRLEDFDGFIIGGGNDIDPAIYGGDVSESPSVDPDRDRFELRVLDFADAASRPVMGICRGAQLINVHAGGTLIADLKPLRRHTSNRGTLLPRKQVRVDGGSVLAGFIGKAETRVNSLHHQAVETCGVGLVETAWDRDDIVQAIESRSGPLRIGVQWHPEYMPQRRTQRRLFAGFARACQQEPVTTPPR